MNLEDDCFVQAIDSEETSIRFYPREDGIHSIHVKLNGVHIPGSPYRIRVGKDVAGKPICNHFFHYFSTNFLLNFFSKNEMSTDPSAVKAEGPGLRDAVSGQKTHFIISTLDAGSGTK